MDRTFCVSLQHLHEIYTFAYAIVHPHGCNAIFVLANNLPAMLDLNILNSIVPFLLRTVSLVNCYQVDRRVDLLFKCIFNLFKNQSLLCKNLKLLTTIICLRIILINCFCHFSISNTWNIVIGIFFVICFFII